MVDVYVDATVTDVGVARACVLCKRAGFVYTNTTGDNISKSDKAKQQEADRSVEYIANTT